MGRGRAKAKQTKVARELKYFSPDTDLCALERELHAQTAAAGAPPTSATGTTRTTTAVGLRAGVDAVRLRRPSRPSAP